MEQKLLALVSRRTAWFLLAGCVAFWVVLALGLLEAPLGTPTALMFLWLYCALMGALACTLLAAASVTALVLHRSAARPAPDDGTDAETDAGADGTPPAEPEDSGDDGGSAALIRKLLARGR